jgi:vacuolar-type H+-ATPase subunit E/Vma4
MVTTTQNSPAVLNAEILADARRDCENIIRRAQAESADLLAAARAEAEELLQKKRESARAEAARRTEMTLATVAVESGRMRSERVEALLENIRDEARNRLLTQQSDCRETVIVLAAEAIRQMSGTEFVLKISPADAAALGNRLAGEIAPRVGRPSLNLSVSSDASITDGGVVVATADGLQIWDNRWLSRLERLWPELRRQIAVQTALVARNGIAEVPIQKGGA